MPPHMRRLAPAGLAGEVTALLLGTAQDAGVPQAGCRCTHCSGVREGRYPRRLVASLALLHHPTRRYWLVDATPDVKHQLDLVDPAYDLAGVLITHGHIGHYLGLAQFGREAMNTARLPLHASERTLRFLRTNAPWSQLFELGNVTAAPLPPHTPTALADGLSVTPYLVPHRAEFTDTYAFLIQGPDRSLLYCPDIDSWDEWRPPATPQSGAPNGAALDARSFIARADVALLDATFYSADELPGRDITEVPHPLATTTLATLGGLRTQVNLVHLNHSNPLYTDAEARRTVLEAGLAVPDEGAAWEL